MKKIKLNTSKLKLTKEKISKLTDEEMQHIVGGDSYTCNPSIIPCPTPTPSGTCAGFCTNYTTVDGGCPPPTPTRNTLGEWSCRASECTLCP